VAPITPPTTPLAGAYEPRVTNPGQTRAQEAKDIFSSDTFLKVLAAQVRSQNPLEPMKDTEFIGQMAQFSSLEQITGLNKTMQAFNLTNQLTQGAALVGRQVTYLPEGTDVPVTGTVERMVIENGGRTTTLVVGGVAVNPAQVREVL
jgi:flagellar basal-body rod modification protein FlgD